MATATRMWAGREPAERYVTILLRQGGRDVFRISVGARGGSVRSASSRTAWTATLPSTWQDGHDTAAV